MYETNLIHVLMIYNCLVFTAACRRDNKLFVFDYGLFCTFSLGKNTGNNIYIKGVRLCMVQV